MADITFKDRVKETCTFDGVNNVVLNGALVGHVLFEDGVTDYVIHSIDETQWEIGEGTVALGELSRDTVYINSEGNTNKIDFGITSGGVAFHSLTADRLNTICSDISVREAASTGRVTGGVLSIASATTIDISAGNGEIVDSYTDPNNPVETDVSWNAFAGVVINVGLTTVGNHIIYIDNLGAVNISTTKLTQQQRRENIIIGTVHFFDGTILSVSPGGPVSNGTSNAFYDYISYLTIQERIKGMATLPVTGALSIYGDTGTIFIVGSNTDVSLANPNIKPFAAIGSDVSAAPFDILTQDGSIHLSAQTVIPDLVELTPNTVTTLVNNRYTIHYVYRTLSNTFILQLGQKDYLTLNEVENNLLNDLNDHVDFVGASRVIKLSQIFMKKSEPDFSGVDAGIIDIFGTTQSLGSGSNGTAIPLLSGTGSPEGVVTALVGSLYTDTVGGIGVTLYVKETGTGNTGWSAK